MTSTVIAMRKHRRAKAAFNGAVAERSGVRLSALLDDRSDLVDVHECDRILLEGRLEVITRYFVDARFHETDHSEIVTRKALRHEPFNGLDVTF
jgi:hypothetical protein